MTNCKYCGHKSEEPVGYKKTFCNICVRDKEIGFNRTIETEFIKDYGRVSRARLREMERRVILPYNKPDGGYYVGRMGENGKVQERHPDYSK